MSYSFWRPQLWRPGALAPSAPPSYATGCSGGGTRENAVPPLFLEGERDPSLFCSISGIFSAEINEQRRLQDSQVLQMLTYRTTCLLEPFAVSQFRRYIYICYK